MSRPLHLEERRARLDPRTRPLDLARQARDGPWVDAPRRERKHPGVAAVEGLELRGAREGVHAVGDHEGRSLVGRVIVEGRACRDGALDVLGERRRRRDDPVADDDERQPRGVGHRERAAHFENLASRRRARMRQPARGDADEAAEPVHRSNIDEAPANVCLAVEHHRDRLPTEGLDRRARDAVQRAPGSLVRAEPDRLHRAIGRRERRNGPCEAAVLHHLRAREHTGEHGGARGDAGDDEQDAAGATR